MALLNYTTSISTEKTAGEIQRKLADAGAQAILVEYDEDKIMSAMSFRIQVKSELISFRLPINVDGVYDVLQADRNIPKGRKTYEQAARVAWRIVKDWIEAQLAIIEAQQADLMQVFLPYAQYPGTGETVYEKLRVGNFRNLITKKEC